YDNLLITAAEEDWYRIDLGAGDRVTAAVKALTAGTVNASLADAAGTILATGAAGPTNVDKVISNFAVGPARAYYVRVAGSQNADYSLVLTQNAAFDTESNDTSATAQNITGSQGVLGQLGASGSNTLTLNWTDSGWWNSSGSHDVTNKNYF